MTTFHFQTHVSDSGVITLPPEFYGRRVIVSLNEMQEEIDEAIDQPKKERRQRMAVERTKIMDRTPEEWQAAVDDFMTSWKGCLKGVPHMTAKEIRAERLEKKYGQRGKNE